MFVEYTGSEEVRKALAELGRTEDVQFSPDGKRLAIAGFSDSRVLILDIDLMAAEPTVDIRFSRATILKSVSFNHPHGVAWADNEILLVANRHGQIPIVRAPLLTNASELLVHPIHLIGESEADFVNTPGSVSLRRLGPGMFEALVCNNYAHTVTRHFLSAEGFAIVGSETVLRNGLNIPDGIAHSRSGEWVAVSNHYANAVYLYRSEQLGSTDHPVGVLRGMGYPHGLSFTPDDRALLVADAGAPYAHLFAAPDGDWTGERIPSRSIRVMDDEAFARGHYNPEEGGPKGLTVSPDGSFLCLTNEEEPLVFVDIRAELAAAGVAPHGTAAPPEAAPSDLRGHLAGALQRARGEHAAALSREKDATKRAVAAEAQISAVRTEAAAAAARTLEEKTRILGHARALEQEVLTLRRRASELDEAAPALSRGRELERQLPMLQLQAEERDRKIARLKRRLQSARQRAAAERAQKVAAKRRIKALLRSASWRLTAPLRAISRRVWPRR